MMNKKEAGKNILKLLYDNPFFAELTPDQMQVVSRYWQVKELPENFILFKEDDEPDNLYYVLEGKLSVLKRVESKNGEIKEVKVAEITKDHLLGELGIIENARRSATVFTLEPSLLLTIRAKHFNLLVKSRPQIGVILMKQVAKLISSQLRNTTGRYANTQLVG